LAERTFYSRLIVQLVDTVNEFAALGDGWLDV
jgi:hypothetical protein